MAKWLHATFGLNSEDARAKNNYALRFVGSKIDVAKWLHETLGLTADDLKEGKYEILRTAWLE